MGTRSPQRRTTDQKNAFLGSRPALKRWLIYAWTLVIGIVSGVLILAFILAGEIYEYQDTVDGVHLPRVDAIVCLAGGRGRIVAAGDIWYRYWELSQGVVPGAGRSPVPERPPLLYISGMGHQSTWGDFLKNLRRGVRGVIYPETVVLEKESFNTEANALWLLRYAELHHWDRVLLMTSPYHMKRARYIFEQVLKKSKTPLAIETLSVFQEPFEPGEWRSGVHGIHVTLQEYLKLIYYRSVWRP
ncbi:MAG: YdcF family protein [Bdellovibrionota bacterium]